MPNPPPTERLEFRGWNTSDLAIFHSICSDPVVMKFVGTGELWSLIQTEQFVTRAREMSEGFGFCQWPLIHKADAVVIGFCGFIPASSGAEIGWRLARPYWGQGLATEAARTVLTYGFETLAFHLITATVQSSNRASIRIMEKLKMNAESSFRRNGRDMLRFSISNPQTPLSRSSR